MSRDLFERIMADLGPDGALDKVLEFCGPAVDEMSISSRMVLCNSVQYLSAQTAIVNPDEKTIDYVKRRTEKDFDAIRSDADASYAQELHYDVTELEPMVVTPPDVYYVKSVTEVEGIDIDQLCTSPVHETVAKLKGFKKVRISEIVRPWLCDIANGELLGVVAGTPLFHRTSIDTSEEKRVLFIRETLTTANVLLMGRDME